MSARWLEILDPFGRMYASFHLEMEGRLEAMSDEELDEVILACREPSMTNCGWTTYNAAPHVKREAETIRHQRERAAKEAALAHPTDSAVDSTEAP